MINRKPLVHTGTVVWLLGLFCIGCSGTPFGEQLTERLSAPDEPAEETAVPNTTVVNPPTGEPLTEQPSESGDPESGDPVEEASPANPTTTTTAMGDPPTPTQEAPPPLNPTPYRLLLRLPAADPAAPAEAVTQALRAAGILFEVETVERLPRPTDPEQPTTPDPSP